MLLVARPHRDIACHVFGVGVDDVHRAEVTALPTDDVVILANMPMRLGYVSRMTKLWLTDGGGFVEDITRKHLWGAGVELV